MSNIREISNLSDETTAIFVEVLEMCSDGDFVDSRKFLAILFAAIEMSVDMTRDIAPEILDDHIINIRYHANDLLKKINI